MYEYLCGSPIIFTMDQTENQMNNTNMKKF